MNLSKRIENLAGRLQAKAHETSDDKDLAVRITSRTLIGLSEELFTLSTELEFDEALADERAQSDADDDLRRRGEGFDEIMSRIR